MSSQVESTVWVNVNPPRPAGKPPASQVGVLGWLRKNLFSSIGNSILTVVTLVVLYVVITGIARWVINAFWTPVWVNRKVFAVGAYPTEQLWQPAVVLMVVCVLVGLSAGHWGSLLRNLGVGLGALLATLVIIPIGFQAQLVMAAALMLLIVGYVIGLKAPIRGNWLALAWFFSLPFTLVMLAGGVTLERLGVEWFFAPPVDPLRCSRACAPPPPTKKPFTACSRSKRWASRPKASANWSAPS